MNRTYEVQGRNGYWGVDEYHPDEPGRCTYGTVILPTRKLATAVAAALTAAYRHGREDATVQIYAGATVTADVSRETDPPS